MHTAKEEAEIGVKKDGIERGREDKGRQRYIKADRDRQGQTEMNRGRQRQKRQIGMDEGRHVSGIDSNAGNNSGLDLRKHAERLIRLRKYRLFM